MSDPAAIRRLDFQGEPHLMGILNVTPDSFSGDGLARERDIVAAAVDQAARFQAEGLRSPPSDASVDVSGWLVVMRRMP